MTCIPSVKFNKKTDISPIAQYASRGSILPQQPKKTSELYPTARCGAWTRSLEMSQITLRVSRSTDWANQAEVESYRLDGKICTSVGHTIEVTLKQRRREIGRGEIQILCEKISATRNKNRSPWYMKTPMWRPSVYVQPTVLLSLYFGLLWLGSTV